MRSAECGIGITRFTRFLMPHCAYRTAQSRFVPHRAVGVARMCAPCVHATIPLPFPELFFMRYRLLPFVLIALAAFPATALAQNSPPATADGEYLTLFDGKSLDNWLMGPDKSWKVVDGEIRLEREFDGKEHNLDYLWTKQQYGDFVLELEFKIPQQANSGVFLRTRDVKDPVFTGIEVQVSNSHGRQEWGKGDCAGAIYDLLEPSANPIYEPGKWNHYTITCQGPKISVVLNGKQIIDMDLDQWTQPHENPDGSQNKFPIALKDFARQGHIGLQDHGRGVAYRNIRVKRLSP